MPDHPWQKAARQGGGANCHDRRRAQRERKARWPWWNEKAGSTRTPRIVELKERPGTINGNLKIGADIAAAQPLIANDLISSPGVKLHGSGFIVTPQQAAALGLGTTPGLEQYILPYRQRTRS